MYAKQLGSQTLIVENTYSPYLLKCWATKVLSVFIRHVSVKSLRTRSLPNSCWMSNIAKVVNRSRGDEQKMWRWIKQLWNGRTTTARVATVYTKPGCLLCDEAVELLEHHGYRVELIDINNSVELQQLYQLEIPVVLIDDKIRFRGRIDPVLLKRLPT
jgi:glutaredoxin